MRASRARKKSGLGRAKSCDLVEEKERPYRGGRLKSHVPRGRKKRKNFPTNSKKDGRKERRKDPHYSRHIKGFLTGMVKKVSVSKEEKKKRFSGRAGSASEGKFMKKRRKADLVKRGR